MLRICRRLKNGGFLRHSEGALATEESQGILRSAQNDGKNSGLFYWIFACVIVYSLVVGKWYSWYGGRCFGYRMMTDMLPFFAFLWIPFVRSPYWEKSKKWFYAAAVWSVGIQLAGIAFYDGVWHNLYDDGSQMSWLWSVRNCEKMYYLRRIIGKLTGVPANQIR